MHLHEIVIGGLVGRSEAAIKHGWLDNEEAEWPGVVIGTHHTGVKQVVQFLVKVNKRGWVLRTWDRNYLEAIEWN